MKRKRTLIFTGIVIILAIGSIIKVILTRDTTIESIPQYVLTYAENQPEDYPTTQGAYRFAKLVYEKTKGRIKIVVHSDGNLGDEVSVIEQIKFGGIDFARVSLMTLGETASILNVLQLPYLYNKSEDMWKVLDGEIGRELMGYLDPYGIKALSWYDAGARHFYTTKKGITRLEDMKGLRIRIAESDLMEELVTALGAEPVRMPYSEVYSGLETGEIDGAENNLPSYEIMSHYKVAEYITLDAHNRIPELQVISATTWNKLSTEDQQIILECAQQSAEYERTLWKEREEESRKIVEDAGGVVIELSDKEVIRFKNALITTYEDVSGAYAELIERIRLEVTE